MPTNAKDLTTVQAVKDYLSGSAPMGSSDDAYIQTLVTNASQFIINQCNRKTFAVQSYTERFRGNGKTKFIPVNDPLVSVGALQVDSTVVALSPDGILSGYQIVDHGNWSEVELIGYEFERGANCFVTYTAGFNPIPEDLAQACIELAAQKFRRRKHIGTSQEAMPQGAGTVSFTKADVTDDIQSVIEQYTLRFK